MTAGMHAAIDIRLARPEDAPGVARVHVDTWRDAYAGVVPNDYLVGMTESRKAAEWDALIRDHRARDAVVVAEARDGGLRGIVGFGNCGPARGRAGGEVYTLYVAPDWQGHGLGRRLLRRLFAVLRERAFDEAVIWVLSDNPARFFYEAQGGRAVAQRRERFARTTLRETAYHWPDLTAWLAARDG